MLRGKVLQCGHAATTKPWKEGLTRHCMLLNQWCVHAGYAQVLPKAECVKHGQLLARLLFFTSNSAWCKPRCCACSRTAKGKGMVTYP
jgi:hypothetical protein